MTEHPRNRRFASRSNSGVPALLSDSVSLHALDGSQCFSQGSSKQPDLLTVLQASPLVYEDAHTGDLVPLESLDFQQERHILETALCDGHMDIDLAFDVATSARLASFLAKGEGRVLHFSCHGHEEFLTLENGLGKMQALEVPMLKRWISASPHHLQFVFVSACHSRRAGEAFVEAGVPHVVCCRHDDAMLRDAAAIEFSKAFYTALACDTPLDRAFKLGRNQVANSPDIPASVRQTEVSKFVLLPEGEDHHVQIFNDQGMRRSPRCLTTSSNTGLSPSPQIPYPPDIFEGRQVDVHKLLVALRSARLLRIAGPKGIGKVSVVQAACHYMRERPDGFPGQILWLPSDDVYCDEVTKLFSSIFNVLGSEPESSLDRLHNVSWYLQCRRSILKAVGNGRFVLVLELRRFWDWCEARFHKITEMLNYLIGNTRHLRAILIQDGVAELGLRIPCIEMELVVAPLGFEPTVHLFGRLCRHVAEQRCRDVRNFRDLGRLLLPSGGPVDTPRSIRCDEIFTLIGEGIPRRIHYKATRMSGDDYDKLISLGLRKQQQPQFSTRAAFDKRYEELTTEMNHHFETEQFHNAQHCKELLDEMEVIKEGLPDLDTLMSMRDQTELDLHRAIEQGEFVHADQVQDQLQSLVEKIQAEKHARRELGAPKPTSPPTLDKSHPCMWAISYNQLLQVRDHSLEVFGKDNYADKTMRDINNHIIEPVCRESGTSYALHHNPDGLRIGAFVTHCWDEPFGAFVESIETHYRGFITKPNLWICAFGLVQGDVSAIQEQLGVRLEESPFVMALQEASSFLVVRNDRTDLYSRIWCVCELFFAKNCGLVPNETAVIGPDTFSSTRSSCLDAAATDSRDKARILRALLRNEGDQLLIDDFIHQFRSH